MITAFVILQLSAYILHLLSFSARECLLFGRLPQKLFWMRLVSSPQSSAPSAQNTGRDFPIVFLLCKAPCAHVTVPANLHDNTLEHNHAKACSFYHLVLCAEFFEEALSKHCTRMSDRGRSTAICWR